MRYHTDLFTSTAHHSAVQCRRTTFWSRRLLRFCSFIPIISVSVGTVHIAYLLETKVALNSALNMSGIKIRDLLDFPRGGDERDTVINGEHLNLTTLHHFHYSLYSNDTISNGSKCYLAFGEHKPFIFGNGTWVNATSCYDPFFKVGTRGTAGVAFASAFAITIMFTLANLKKHGTLHLPVTKKFAPVSRRWQWYWMLALAAAGCISGFMSIDVDRNYCQSMAIMLQSFFFFLMVPIMLATVWEGVRHWYVAIVTSHKIKFIAFALLTV